MAIATIGLQMAFMGRHERWESLCQEPLQHHGLVGFILDDSDTEKVERDDKLDGGRERTDLDLIKDVVSIQMELASEVVLDGLRFRDLDALT